MAMMNPDRSSAIIIQNANVYEEGLGQKWAKLALYWQDPQANAGQTIDFLLTAWRDAAAALRFFRKAIRHHGEPEVVTIDKSGANTASPGTLNVGKPDNATQPHLHHLPVVQADGVRLNAGRLVFLGAYYP